MAKKQENSGPPERCGGNRKVMVYIRPSYWESEGIGEEVFLLVIEPVVERTGDPAAEFGQTLDWGFRGFEEAAFSRTVDAVLEPAYKTVSISFIQIEQRCTKAVNFWLDLL